MTKTRKIKLRPLWDQNVPLRLSHFSQTNPVIHFLLRCAISNTPCQPFFTLGQWKHIRSAPSCPLPARLIKACSWGAFHQTLCNPSVDNSKILCDPRPWHRSELLPDVSIKPRRGKTFPKRGYTPVTTCGKIKHVIQWDTSLEQGNIYPSSQERSWKKTSFVG